MAIYDDTEYRTLRASLLNPISSIVARFAFIDNDEDPISALHSLAETIQDLQQQAQNLTNWFVLGYGRTTSEDKDLLADSHWVQQLLYRQDATDSARG